MNEVNEASPAGETGDLERLVRRQCICCANGNDLPDGEWCRACNRGKSGPETTVALDNSPLGAAIRAARAAMPMFRSEALHDA